MRDSYLTDVKGRIGRFLNVSTEVSGLAKVGPIKTHSDTVAKVIRSPQTAVHFVTTLEEMPVQETLDGIAELRELTDGAIRPGGIIVNMARPAMLPDGDLAAAASGSLDVGELATGLKAAGIGDDHGLATDLMTELREHAQQVALQNREREELRAAGRPQYELPMLTDGIDLAGLYQLATLLRQQGAA
jgi:hypothetical protein